MIEDNIDPEVIELAEGVAALTRAMILKANPNGDSDNPLLNELEEVLGEMERALGEVERDKG